MSPPLTMLLLDTNVWLDYYLPGREGHTVAAKLVERACERDVELLFSVGSSKDLYYITTLYFKRAARAQNGGELSEAQAAAASRMAWACLEHLDELATVVGCDQSDVWLARKQRALHADYEDDLVIAATLRAAGSCLISNDEQLLRHAPVPALTPADALAYLEG